MSNIKPRSGLSGYPVEVRRRLTPALPGQGLLSRGSLRSQLWITFDDRTIQKWGDTGKHHARAYDHPLPMQFPWEREPVAHVVRYEIEYSLPFPQTPSSPRMG